MEPQTTEARSVVTQLRKRVTARRARWQPGPVPGPPVRTPMTENSALHYLHEHWVLPDGPSAPATTSPWKRQLWRVVGRFTFGALHQYLTEERDLLSRVVQVCDTLAKRVDTLEAEIEQLALVTSRQLAEVASYLPDPGPMPDPGLMSDTGAGTDSDTGPDRRGDSDTEGKIESGAVAGSGTGGLIDDLPGEPSAEPGR